MMPPTHRIVRLVVLCSVLVGLLASGSLTPVTAQVLPPLINPSPGSSLTTTTVTFTGEHASQAGEQHWLSVETAPFAKDIYNQAMGTGHTATVSNLPTSGTLYVRYHTYTPVAGWNSQSHTFTMNVGNGNSDNDNTNGGNTGNPNPTLRWDQRFPTAARFELLQGGNSLLDKETGLAWQQNSSAGGIWIFARNHCINRAIDGRKGWRLPSVHELASLLDTNEPNPAIALNMPNGPFEDFIGGFYWSATTNSATPTLAWGLNFSNGEVEARPKTEFHPVWCVRGGGPLSEY